MAPLYDRFIRLTGVDHAKNIPEWLAPVENMDVLDLGGGTGMNAATLSGAGARVIIADTSLAMLKRAAKKKMPVTLVRAKAESLPLPDSSFDIALISDAWHHFADQTRAVSEVVRVLRPAGRLYIIDFAPHEKITKAIAFFEKMLAEPSAFTPPDELVQILRQAGIEGFHRPLPYGQYIYEGRKTL